MSSFRIRGDKKINGEIRLNRNKNYTTKLKAATILTDKPCTLKNVPRVRYVFVMLKVMEEAGAYIKWRGKTVVINTERLNPHYFSRNKDIEHLRASIVFLGPLLARYGSARLPFPGGDLIGVRPLTAHFRAFEDLGFKLKKGKNYFELTHTAGLAPANITRVVLDEFSVTATENIMMYAAARSGKLEIATAAYEPHVQDLAVFLNKMGARIEFKPFHQISVAGKSKLHGTEHKAINDYLEAGTFIILALAAGGDITVRGVPSAHLELFLSKLIRSGARIEEPSKGIMHVRHSPNLAFEKIQTMIYPGIPTDMQQPLGVLATQLRGEVLIHDPLYEGRMKYLQELKKMGADIRILDDHRASIRGPRRLRGAELTHFDIRGGMSFIIAGLVASGTTIVHNAEQIDRGYEDIDKRLRKLGADIERI